MAIFLTVLKIIGITLLVILGLILLILLLVLFVPIRYRIYVNKDKEKEIKDIEADVRVTWLLHFINVLITYKNKLFYRIRITLFTIKSSEEKPKKKIKEKREKKSKTTGTESYDVKPVDYSQKSKDFKLEGFDDESENESETIISNDDGLTDDNADFNEDSNTLEADDATDDKKNIFEIVFDIVKKIISVLSNIESSIEKAINKVKEFLENIEYYIDAINDEKNQEAFKLCLNELNRVLKNIKPQKAKGFVRYGTDDPYSNGKAASVFSILNPFLGENVRLISDFEEEVMEGNLLLKGRVTIFVLLVAGCKVYFNKDVKRMIKIFKRED